LTMHQTSPTRPLNETTAPPQIRKSIKITCYPCFQVAYSKFLHASSQSLLAWIHCSG
jgi:hypothetical protein